ncbi:MAG: cob(I)yrinic acid a,c-diamide adenosyltransferase [Chloroflexota bacterium]|jgi:cob(I)alamin adenosyltransferase
MHGLLQVYTGDGKGKSTAAIGQAVRAVGHGLRVAVVCLFKDPEVFGDGEFEPLRRLGIESHFFARRHPHFYHNVPSAEVRAECLKALEFIRKLVANEAVDVLVLDELNIAVRDGFLTEDEVMEVVERRPPDMEFIVTGRGAPARLMEKADLVTEVRRVKHPYDRGQEARAGFEY